VHFISEESIKQAEEHSPNGLTSSEILRFFETHSVRLSEATLRKYVQLGLLPRSIRVGEKGKHRGSKGVYPVRVLRQILLIKQLLSSDFTIEQIRSHFVFLSREIDELEQSLSIIIEGLRQAATRNKGPLGLSFNKDLSAARGVGRDLLNRLRVLQQHLGGEANASQEAIGVVG
jgi:DNA-binding transcriptional MerR regulator